MEMTEGPVLELGLGICSTPLLHWLCIDQGRKLVSYENDQHWFDMHKKWVTPDHEIHFIEDWGVIPYEDQRWGLALVDQHPELSRKDSILALSDDCDIIIAHDTNEKYDFAYKYMSIWDLFTYRYDYKVRSPYTTVVSNFIDVNKLGETNDKDKRRVS